MLTSKLMPFGSQDYLNLKTYRKNEPAMRTIPIGIVRIFVTPRLSRRN